MKKIVFGLVGLFIASQLMVSCSADSEMLSQFSKRKYLKKFKSKDVKYEDKVGELETEIAYETKQEEIVTAAVEQKVTSVQAQEEKSIVFATLSTDKQQQITKVKTLANDYSEWNKYNRKTDFIDFEKQNKTNNLYHHENLKFNNKASEVIIAILCIFLPPVAIILYEDTVTANFWVGLLLTLLFWFPGMIFAFLVCFAGVSV